MTTDIFRLIGEALGAVIAGLLAVLVPKIRAYFEAKTAKIEDEKLIVLIKAYVEGAEQVYKGQSGTGYAKLSYVQMALETAGIEWNENIRAMVEGAVYQLNKEADIEGLFK